MRRRVEHGPQHDIITLLVAITALATLWLLAEATDYDEPEDPTPPPSGVVVNRDKAAQAPSRATVRTAGRLRWGGANPQPSGGPELSGEVTPRPAVGTTLRCIRWHESRNNYRAYNGIDHYGAYQLAAQYSDTWARRYGHPAWANVTADHWPRRVQDDVARQLFADWPAAWSTLGACT